MKRILAMLLAIMLVATLAGCGNDRNFVDEEPRNTETPSEGLPLVEQTKEPESTPEPGDEPAPTKQVVISNQDWKSAEDAPDELPGEKDYLEKDSVRLSALLGMDVNAFAFEASPVSMREGKGLGFVDAVVPYLVPTGSTELLDKYILTLDSVVLENNDGPCRRASYTFQYYEDKDGNPVPTREEAYIIYPGNVRVSMESTRDCDEYCFYSYATMQQAFEYATILPIDQYRTFSAFDGPQNGILAEVRTDKWNSYSRQANACRYVGDDATLQLWFFSQASTDVDATLEEIMEGGQRVLTAMEDDVFSAYGLSEILEHMRLNPTPLNIA